MYNEKLHFYRCTDPKNVKDAFVVDVCSDKKEAITLMEKNIREDKILGLGLSYKVIKKILDRDKYYGRNLVKTDGVVAEYEHNPGEGESNPTLQGTNPGDTDTLSGYYNLTPILIPLDPPKGYRPYEGVYNGNLEVVEVECIKTEYCDYLEETTEFTKGVRYITIQPSEEDEEMYEDYLDGIILTIGDTGEIVSIGLADSNYFMEFFKIIDVRVID